jgi:DNA-binding LacI/PurR family transcriptional regulator
MPTRKEEITLKDIAEAVGKSVAAVSRALNNYDDISEETRDYIKQVAREMGYAPTNTLGLIIPALSPRASDAYYSELLAGIANAAAEQNFDLLVLTCVPGPAEEAAYLRLIDSRRVDAMIVARPRWRDTRIELLLNKKFPFAVVGASNLPGEFISVADDASRAIVLMVEHLVLQGHKRIALVNTPTDLFFSSEILAGFRQAMRQANLFIPNDFLEQSDFNQRDGYRAGQTLLSKPETPTAIIAADDVVALGVMAAAQDQGLEIGQDLAITGYGDILLAEYAQPPLTTIHRPTYAFGQQAGQMLIARLNGEKVEHKRVIVEPSLVIRQSSDLALWL